MSASNPLGHVACKASVANPGPGPGDIVIISAREEACAIPNNSIHCTVRVVNSHDDVGKSVLMCSSRLARFMYSTPANRTMSTSPQNGTKKMENGQKLISALDVIGLSVI
ncbi:hypothetical protein KQX54_021446 [Cotesia glomerata]|uniref:Uncharacterized protein n=1 Tax=Cotesia glomerata TaxID=32391 RepID=A0AAV7J786_COTGL|nr:hypothetical protein KQX54_021446 [Cotesia glomerata]